MSSTYRQSSQSTTAMHARDPENRLLARGPRFRLDGEVIRDTGLAVSGLLDAKVGGPSVYPYHPQGLWMELNNRPKYSREYPHPKERNQLYRRSMYTFWKRSVPPPSMATFDAPEREYCVVRRSRTNRMMNEGGDGTESRIEYGFTLCSARAPNSEEMALLCTTYDERLKQYRADAEAADKLLSVGHSSRDDSLDLAEHAAYTQIARMLLNLSEFLTKG